MSLEKINLAIRFKNGNLLSNVLWYNNLIFFIEDISVIGPITYIETTMTNGVINRQWKFLFNKSKVDNSTCEEDWLQLCEIPKNETLKNHCPLEHILPNASTKIMSGHVCQVNISYNDTRKSNSSKFLALLYGIKIKIHVIPLNTKTGNINSKGISFKLFTTN